MEEGAAARRSVEEECDALRAGAAPPPAAVPAAHI
eukprot:gene26160-49773_t